MDVLPVPCCDFYGTRHSARKGSDPTSVQKYLETEKRQNPLNTESDRDRDVTDKGHRRAWSKILMWPTEGTEEWPIEWPFKCLDTIMCFLWQICGFWIIICLDLMLLARSLRQDYPFCSSLFLFLDIFWVCLCGGGYTIICSCKSKNNLSQWSARNKQSAHVWWTKAEENKSAKLDGWQGGGLHQAIPGRRVILRIAGWVTRFS